MKLYRLRDHGSLDHLALEEASPPPVGADEVLVSIRAAALNARALVISMGLSHYAIRPGLIPLSDGPGEAIACGESVNGLEPRDRVGIPFRHDRNSVWEGKDGSLSGYI